MHCKICNAFLTFAEEQYKNFYREPENTCFTCLREAGIIIPAVNDLGNQEVPDLDEIGDIYYD